MPKLPGISHATAVRVFTKLALASEWATLESGGFRFCDPNKRVRRFFPLRVSDSKIRK